MAKRPEKATVDLKVRMKEPLRADLEKAAARRGVSMNTEAVARLQRSFDEDKALGAGVTDIGREVMVAFAVAGQNAARAAGKDGKPDDWLRDINCFREASAAAVVALLLRAPDWKSASGRKQHFDAINSWVAFHDANYPAKEA